MATIASLLALTNATRVLEDVRALRAFGASADPLRVSRPALGDDDMAARRWVASRMEAAGLLGVQTDGLGTVYGSAGVDNAPALLMGSHTDTRGLVSWLDGALGLAYALEAARVLQQGGAADWTAWSVIDWQLDESKRFGGTLLAPSAFVSEDAIFVPTKSLWSARKHAGVAGVPVMHASGRHGGWAGYLEAHVERGARLKRADAALGVAGAITGRRRLRLSCSGDTAADGTATDGSALGAATAEGERPPPTLEAMRLSTKIDDGLRALCDAWEDGGCNGAWSFGDFEGFDGFTAEGGAAGANLTVELRSSDGVLLDRMARLIGATVGCRGCALQAAGPPVPATTLDAGLVDCVRHAAVATAGEARVVAPMTSASVHAASSMAQVMPSAMLLVPSAGAGGGVDWDDERTATELADGARAFVRAAVGLALGACESEGGSTCILGDKRRNVRLSGSVADWSEALGDDDEADGVERDVTGRAEPATADHGVGLDVEDYPDL